MKTRIYPLFVFIFICCFYGCKDPSETSGPGTPVRDLTNLEKQILSADNSFGISLVRTLNQDQAGKNVIVSPLSISMAFGMVMNGADGSTKTALQNTLGFHGLSDNDINQSYRNILDIFTQLDSRVKLQIANSIWYRNGLPVEQTFLDVNRNHFDAEVQALDFSDPGAKDIINGWVNQKTNGLIPAILDAPIPDYMIMYLINALYFKGSWTTTFDSTKTFDGQFTASGGTQLSCKMMARGDSLYCFEDGTIQAVRLPYGNGAYEMIIVLPLDENGIDGYVAGLAVSGWTQLMSQFAKKDGELYLPRFKLTDNRKLNDVLKQMGMSVAFSPDSADFSRICVLPGANIYIDEVLHKTYIEVNEEGTEAAAVTSIGMGATSVGPGKFIMNIDHPFLFCIRESSSGALVFIGKVATLAE